jgi:hypothetical protein
MDRGSFDPSFRIDVNETKPILDVEPHPSCEAASEKKVRRRFLRLVAKLAIFTILPPPAVEPIRHPHSIL